MTAQHRVLYWLSVAAFNRPNGCVFRDPRLPFIADVALCEVWTEVCRKVDSRCYSGNILTADQLDTRHVW